MPIDSLWLREMLTLAIFLTTAIAAPSLPNLTSTTSSTTLAIITAPATLESTAMNPSLPTTSFGSCYPSGSEYCSPSGDLTHVNMNYTGFAAKTLATPPPSPDALSSGPVAHKPVTATPYIIGSQTLVPNGPVITLAGQVLSLEQDGSSVVVDGSPIAIGDFLATATELLVGTQIPKADGSMITVSGTAASLQVGGLNVVGGVTESLNEPLGSATTTINGGPAGTIATVGGLPTPTTSTTSYVQTGGTAFNGTVLSGGGNVVTGKPCRKFWVLGAVIGVGVIGMGLL
jgi:hypothetical protein